MSQDQLRAFLEKLDQDAALRAALREIGTRDGDRFSVPTVDLIAFASRHGFEFTAKHIVEQEAQLSDEDLEHVSGGADAGQYHIRIYGYIGAENAAADTSRFVSFTGLA